MKNGDDALTLAQARELAIIAKMLLGSLDDFIDPWLERHDFPPDDYRPRVAALMTVLDSFAFMLIANEFDPEYRLEANRLVSVVVDEHLKAYHADTGQ